MTRRVLLSLAAGLLLAGCGGSTSTQKAPEPPAPAATQAAAQPASGPIGSEARDGDLAVTLSGLRVVTAASGAARGIPAPERGQYVTVTAHIANSGVQQATTGPGVFYLQTADGQRWDVVSADTAFDPQLEAGATVAGGDQVTGTLVWDVPAAHGKIVYEPEQTPLYSWTF